MTCIVGITDGKRIVVGGDSAAAITELVSRGMLPAGFALLCLTIWGAGNRCSTAAVVRPRRRSYTRTRSVSGRAAIVREDSDPW
jgi:hypothetical protein